MKWNRWMIGALGATLAVTVAVGTISTTFAQEPGTPPAQGSTVPDSTPGLRGPRGERGGPGGIGRGASLATIASSLGIAEAELQSALQAGQTVAELATANGVDLQTIVDAIVAEHQTRLDQAVADGRLTQEEADERLATLEAELPTQLSTAFTPGMGGPKGDMKSGLGRGAGLTTIATALGIEESELTAALQAGQSIAQVATEQGVELSTVIDVVVAERTTALQEAVSAGRLTQEQADAQLANLEAHLTEHFNQAGGMMPGMGGPGGPRHGGRGPRPGDNPGGEQPVPESPLSTPVPSSESSGTGDA